MKKTSTKKIKLKNNKKPISKKSKDDNNKKEQLLRTTYTFRYAKGKLYNIPIVWIYITNIKRRELSLPQINAFVNLLL